MVVSFTIQQLFHVLALLVALALTWIGASSIISGKGTPKGFAVFLFVVSVILLSSPLLALRQ